MERVDFECKNSRNKKLVGSLFRVKGIEEKEKEREKKKKKEKEKEKEKVTVVYCHGSNGSRLESVGYIDRLS